MDARLLTRLLAAARIGIGGTLFAAPRTAARLWLGQDDLPPATAILARGLGARDLALGVGLLVTLDNDQDPAPWLDAGVAADTADAAAALLARKSVSGTTLAATTAVAGGAAVLGLLLKRQLATLP